MKKIVAGFIVWLCLALPVLAGSVSLLGAGKAPGGGSSPTFNFQNIGDFSAVTTFNFVKGAGTINSGDIIVIAAGASASGSDPGSLLPTGFTAIYNVFDGASTAVRYFVAYKVAGGAESGSYATPTILSSTGTWAMAVYSGSTGGVDAASTGTFATSDSLSVIAPSISVSVGNERIVVIGIDNIGDHVFTDFGGGATARVNTSSAGGTHNMTVIVGDISQTASGATGTFTATQTFFANKSLGSTIGLKP